MSIAINDRVHKLETANICQSDICADYKIPQIAGFAVLYTFKMDLTYKLVCSSTFCVWETFMS